MLYVIGNTLPSSWFLKYRGLATGIATSGCGVGAAIQSICNNKLLQSLDFRWTLRINAIVSFTMLCIAMTFIKERECLKIR